MCYSIQNFNPGNMTFKISYLKILSDEAVRNGWTLFICIFSRSRNPFGPDAEMFNKGNYFDHNIMGEVLFILDQGTEKSLAIHSLASNCFEKKKFGYCRSNMRIVQPVNFKQTYFDQLLILINASSEPVRTVLSFPK